MTLVCNIHIYLMYARKPFSLFLNVLCFIEISIEYLYRKFHCY